MTGVLALSISLLFPILAHSVTELETWLTEWQHQVEQETAVTPELLSEYLEMRDRHPYWLDGPPPTPTLVFRGIGANVEQWRGLVAAHFPASEVDTALCVMQHESGGNSDAKNPISSARGLFQVLASLWAPHFNITYESLYDPETNVRIARAVWDQQGWGAWSAYPKCS